MSTPSPEASVADFDARVASLRAELNDVTDAFVSLLAELDGGGA